MRRVSTLAVGAAVAALTLAASGSPRAVKEGGTFQVAFASGFFDGIDPALTVSSLGQPLLRPACGALMAYPDLPPPAGMRLAPDLAASEPVVSRDGRTFTFTVRKDTRFSDGTPVTARAFSRALERMLDPAMNAGAPDLASLVVGANAVLGGKATSPSGVTTNGRKITFQLTKRASNFPSLTTTICAVPPNLPADPEGAKAPLPSPAPYYVGEYVPGERLVLDRNRFYTGTRPHHLDRIVADLAADEGSIVDEVASGKVDWGFVTNTTWAERTAELARRYGINRTQFFVDPLPFVRMFVLNTSRPLFRNNVKLRQAVNFAADRAALTTALGPSNATPTDHYLLGFKTKRIYPLKGPDLATARKLARGRTRSGKAVLYTRDAVVDLAQAEILRQNLKAIGIQLQVVKFPGQVIFDKLASGRKEFDIGRIGWGTVVGPQDPSLLGIFDGRTLGRSDNTNWSYFDSSKVNRLLDAASRLTGAKRYQAYEKLDVQISRDAAPAIPYAFQNSITFVSARVGCVVRNPTFDLTAACLK
jgi:peptide/nickel transport system substrate-binding protein